MSKSFDQVSGEATPPQAILETVVYCEDLDAALWFYKGVVGLPLVSSDPGRHLFFRVGDSMLLVFNPAQSRNATVRVGNQVIPRHGPDGASHFAFQVGTHESEAIKEHLHENEISIESEIDWPGGGRSIYCRDPAGNSVEFATRTLWFAAEHD